MLEIKRVSLLFIIFLILVVANCASKVTPTSILPQAPAVTHTPESQLEVGWEQKWESLKAEARKEGRLVFYGSAGPTVTQGLGQACKEKFGINLEWVTGRTGEIEQKLLTERRAGIYFADIFISGIAPLTVLKPQGVYDSLDPVLFLPEVLDKKAWYGGELIWAEPDHFWVGILCFPQPPVVINTTLVKPGEVKGYRDLLDPKWKGKIALYDPTTVGAGNAWFTAVWVGIMGLDYLREFARQEPVLVDNARLHMEWVARGKYPVAVAPRTEQMLEFKREGATIEIISPIEGVHLTPSAGSVSLINKAPHPNAAKVFLNWVLTREGVTLVSKLIGGHGARTDVPTDFLPPELVRIPGHKYFSTIPEEYQWKKEEGLKLAKEIFGPLKR